MRHTAGPFICPPLESDRSSLLRDQIRSWVRSAALERLVSASGATLPAQADLECLVAWLVEFSERWDFRRLQLEATARDTGEGARWLLDDSHWTADQRVLILECAASLGLIGADRPAARSYDYVLVLGGAKLSCLLRPRLAADVILRVGVRTGEVVLLGSSRPVAESEREATDTYAPGAATEFDLLRTGAELAFGLTAGIDHERYDDPANPNRSWRMWHYQVDSGSPPVTALSAPSSEPDTRRANSSDTYKFFLTKYGVPPGSSLLLVTSEIYVPYQQLEAIRTIALPHQLLVETIGFPAAWGGALQGMAGPSNYLQEIRSTIQSAARLLSAISGEGGSSH